MKYFITQNENESKELAICNLAKHVRTRDFFTVNLSHSNGQSKLFHCWKQYEMSQKIGSI